MDLLNTRFAHVSPIYTDNNKFVIELETNDNVTTLYTLSIYGMWGWVRALKAATKYWRSGKEEDKPRSWESSGGVYRAYLEVDTGEKVIVGFGLINLQKSFELTIGYTTDSVFGQPGETHELNLKGLCAIVISADFNVPTRYQLQVQVDSQMFYYFYSFISILSTFKSIFYLELIKYRL